ncbi:MAG: two-component sensor histidine kinase [Ahrensia sp.]|nr:two-component sensor histidine kinase [Ahrensia sp.]|tara:strand:- start:36396 stop:37763 length:1368 start_codon:yes stop_codon:yes gene_type:complete
MRMPRSLQARLALLIGLPVTVLWLLAASFTAHLLNGELEEVFDRALQATAERILPLAVHDLRRRGDDHEDDDELGEHIGRVSPLDDKVSYIVRDRDGGILLRSSGAREEDFPPFTADGFIRTSTHRLYYDSARDARITIAVAEPLDHRSETSRAILLGLLLPLLVVIPLSLAAIFVATRRGFRPVRTLQDGLKRRGAQDLSPLPDTGLPTELQPIAGAVNQLLDRLHAAFEAERAFAANAAHELRTPVAGAIAQAQRLKSETTDAGTSQRATEIETTLKRLMRMSEKLMQLARAEGSRLQLDTSNDLRQVLQLIVQDFTRSGEERISLSMPDAPVDSNLDPDAFGILCRNLIENALRHGTADQLVQVDLSPDGVLSVRNDGPVLSPDMTERLMLRFERGSGNTDGSGLGLAIVKAIADRAGARISVMSPLQNSAQGVQISVAFASVGNPSPENNS